MKYNCVRNIKTRGFQILPIGKATDMSTSCHTYIRYPTEYNGGIYIEFDIAFQNNENGFAFFSQFSTHHKISITTTDKQTYNFEEKTPLKDTLTKDAAFYGEEDKGKFHVENGKLQKSIIFWDAPFRQLMDFWEKIDYHIEFENWLQFNSNGVIQPICSFKWKLEGQADKVNGSWKLVSNSYSTQSDITKSIEVKSQTEPYKEVKDFPHLGTKTEEFHSEVLKKIKQSNPILQNHNIHFGKWFWDLVKSVFCLK